MNNADRVRGVGGRAKGRGRFRGEQWEEEEEEDESDREEEEDKDQEQKEWSLMRLGLPSLINHGLTMREPIYSGGYNSNL